MSLNNEMDDMKIAPDEGQDQPHGVDAQVFVAKRSKFPTVGDLFAMLGIFFVAQVVSAFVGLMMGVPISDLTSADPEIIGKFLGITSIITYVLTFTGILAYRHARGGRGTIARFSVRGLNPALLLWGFLFVIATGVVLEPLLNLLPAPPTQAYGAGAWTMLALVVLAPIFEELICRGVVLESLRARYGILIACLVSALFFGVIHFYPQLVVNAFFLGLIFAFLYIRTGSLWIVIILHALNNAIAYLAMVMGYDSFLLADLIADRTIYVLVYIVAAALFAVSGWMGYHTLRELDRQEKNRAEA